jgi:leucyl aminopeptidase
MVSTLEKLTSFHNRYCQSKIGREAAEWLFEKIKEVAKENNKKGLDVKVTQFEHEWKQHSIIARIEGFKDNKETVIVGSHQDSVNSEDDTEVTARAPGADDDGSGTVSVLEAFRLLLVDGYQPLRPIEFHWYSAEEVGLRGSQAIATAYREQGRVVMGMMQLDMTGYPDPVPDMGIEVDFVDPKLTDLLRDIAKTYTPLKTKDFKCGYACSDHASWNKTGYPVARPGETSTRPLPNRINMHSARDDLNTVNYKHMLEYAKLAVGWVVELSHE